jgi:hypothetical protein
MSYDPYQDRVTGPEGQPWSGNPYVTSPAEPFQPADQYFGTSLVDVGYPAPPPPPKQHNVGLIIVCTVLATVLAGAVVFCGLGLFGVILAGSSAGATSSKSPTPAGSAHPSATPSAALGQEVRPAGAPYSYRIPAGFHSEPVPTSTEPVPPRTEPVPRSTAAGGPSPSPDTDPPPAEDYETAITTKTGSTYDFVYVASFTVKQEANAANEAALGAEFDRWIKTAGQNPASRTDVQAGNYSAFKYTFTQDAAKAFDYFVFNGRTVVDVTCQWADDQVNIERGCQEVLKSLTIDA